jgi:8-oxo-dGTP diphosphatase
MEVGCPVLKVAAGVIEQDGKVLIARRAPHKNLAGKWEFPGGKIEDGETPEEALKRELMEEFQVVVDVGDWIAAEVHHYPTVSVELTAFRVRLVRGDFLLDSHDRIEWVLPGECYNYDLAEADWFIVRKLVGVTS